MACALYTAHASIPTSLVHMLVVHIPCPDTLPLMVLVQMLVGMRMLMHLPCALHPVHVPCPIGHAVHPEDADGVPCIPYCMPSISLVVHVPAHAHASIQGTGYGMPYLHTYTLSI